MNDSKEATLREVENRVRELEQTLLLLSDFAMMTTLWLSRFGSDETIGLTKRWFTRQLDRILVSCNQSPDSREHLLRFSRLFEQMDSLPTSSPVRENLWQTLIQKLRTEAESS
jgi:hypothetical protein